MKYKYMLSLAMAATLPVMVLAANTTDSTIPVVKVSKVATVTSDTTDVAKDGKEANPADAVMGDVVIPEPSAVEAKMVQDHNSISYRVSSTAAPEQNRLMRDKAGVVTRTVRDTITPDADTYTSRMAVGVSPFVMTADHIDITFPTVTSVSRIVEKNINDTIRKYVSSVQNKVQDLNRQDDNKTNVIMYYDVKTDKRGLFSVVLYTYTIQDKAANGIDAVKGFTFNTTTGRLLSLTDLGGMQVADINASIQDNTVLQQQVGADFSVTSVPKEYYVDDNRTLVMIVQEMDEGLTHSAGTVYIPVRPVPVK